MQRLQDELAKFLVFANGCSTDASELVEMPTNALHTDSDCDDISSNAAATRAEDPAQRAHDLADEEINVQVDEIIDLYSPSSSTPSFTTPSSTSPPSTTPSSSSTAPSLPEDLEAVKEELPDLQFKHRLVLDESAMLCETYQNALTELEKLNKALFCERRQHAMMRERNLANLDENKKLQSALALTTTWLDDALNAKEQLEERPDDALEQLDEWRKCKEKSESEYGRLWDKHQNEMEELAAWRKWKNEAVLQYGHLLNNYQKTMSAMAKIEDVLWDKPHKTMNVLAKIEDAFVCWRCALAGPQP
jgi:hypothetical protein